MKNNIGLKISLAVFLVMVLATTVILVIKNPYQINLVAEKIKQITFFKTTLNNPFIEKIDKEEEFPLLRYSIVNLSQYSFQPSQIIATELISSTPEFDTYLFHYTTMEKTMSGAINIPKSKKKDQALPVIILVRGWVPLDIYQPGVGTKNAAKIFAENGYVTLALDFFGYAQSDPDFEDTWKSRFIKPINLIELIESVKHFKQIKIQTELNVDSTIKLNEKQLGIWAHSNGGQIALTALEATSKPIPTTLWAPVVAPFPYSILFFSDENEDEGKAARKWVALFEEKYDVFDFSLTKHLDKLAAPLQLHHGTSDEAAIIAWSDEFIDKINQENKIRQKNLEEKEESEIDLSASDSTASNQNIKPVIFDQIEIDFYRYQGADHNLQPNQNWNQAIERDLNFFNKHLLSVN